VAYWLFKTEPETWSWDAQVKMGTEPWDGVRNHQANNNMKAMKKGELGFFYHSGGERQVVGIVAVAQEHHPDTTDGTGRFGRVAVKTVKPFPAPVTLAAIKANPKLANMVLVKNSRLSVQPVSDAEWREVCRMGGVK